MSDIFDQIQPDSANKGDIFDQISSNSARTPADINPQMQQAKDGTDFLTGILPKAISTATDEYLGNLAKGAYSAVSPVLNNMTNSGFNPNGMFAKNMPPQGTDLKSIMDNYNPDTSNLGGQIARGIGYAAPTIAMANPMIKAAGALPLVGNLGKLGLAGITPSALGFGAINKAQGGSFLQGAGQGALFGGAGLAGSTAANALVNPLAKAFSASPEATQLMSKFAPNFGTAAGMGTAGAISAPSDQKVSSAIMGAGLGAITPMNPLNAPTPITTEQLNDMIDKNANTYRDVLNPNKGILQKVEIKSGKDIDDAFKLATQEGLVINRDVENKLDTRGAIAQIQPKISNLHQQLTDALSSDPNKQFDLEDLRGTAKDNLSGNIKNAEDLEKSHAQVDSAIDAEIARNGQFVNGSTLNNIKQGLWSKSYDPLAPNSNGTSRQIGNVAKNMIEDAYPQDNIQDLNKSMGQYINLQKILESSHGNVVQNGKIGKYAAQGTGMVTGAILGAHLPLLGEIVGPLAGREIGGKVSDFMNDPARITGNMAKQIKNVKITDPQTPVRNRIGAVTPELLNQPAGKTIPQPTTNAIGFNPINRLGITDQSGPINSRFNPRNPFGAIVTPNVQGNGVIPAGRPIPPYTPGSQALIHPWDNNIGAKTLAVGGAMGLGSMFNPLNNAQAAQVKDPDRLKLPGDQYTKKEEGFQAHPYMDTKGNKTIGYGFKMDSVGSMLPRLVQEGKRPLTKQEADGIYNKLYSKARNSAQSFAGDSWHSLNGQQQKAITDMSYNMGGKLNGFKKLRQAIEDGDYNAASNEILNSNYAKEAKNRAMRDSELMKG